MKLERSSSEFVGYLTEVSVFSCSYIFETAIGGVRICRG